MTPSKNSIKAVLDTFVSPINTFAAVHKHGRWAMLPYLLLLLSSLLLWGAYFNGIDLNWLHQNLAAQLQLTGNEFDISQISKGVLFTGELLSDQVGRTVFIIMLALWLKLSTKGSQYQHSFGKWFAASCFIMLPAVLGDIASIINVLLNSTPVMPNAADLNSINGLVKLPLNHDWVSFTTTMPFMAPWYMYLTFAALTAWTDLPRSQAITIATLPWLLTLIIWPISIWLS